MNRNFLFCNILTVMLFLLTEVPLYAQNNIVHAYTPFTIPATGPSGVAYPSHVRNDVISVTTILLTEIKGIIWMLPALPQTA